MVRFLLCLAICLVMAACDGRVELADDLTAALQAQAERNWPLAERLLQRFLRTGQDQEKRWEAWQTLVEVINAETQEPRETLEFLEVMLQEFVDDEEKCRSILEQTARLNERLGRYDRAADAWSAYLDLSVLGADDMADGYRNLARMQMRQRHFESAEVTLGQCLVLADAAPQVLYCMYDLADLHAGRENWKETANLCQQVLENRPPRELQGLVSYLWGDALEQLGQFEAAMKQFEAARECYPNPPVIESRIVSLRKKIRKQ